MIKMYKLEQLEALRTKYSKEIEEIIRFLDENL